MKKHITILLSTLLFLSSLTGCGNSQPIEIKNVKIICDSFVPYDVTRNLIQNTDLTVEQIDTSTELSGRDRNKINNSALFICTNDLTDIDDDINKIKIKDIISSKEIKKDDNKINDSSFALSISTEEDAESSEKNTQIIVNSNNQSNSTEVSSETNTDSANDSESQQSNDDNSNLNSNNTNTSNNENTNSNEATDDTKDENILSNGIKIEYVDVTFSEAPPSSCDENGYSLGNLPYQYEASSIGDDYQKWICNKINSMTDGGPQYAILNNGDDTYTLFTQSGWAYCRYQVIHLDDIYIPQMLEAPTIYCDSSLRGKLTLAQNNNNDAIALAKTVDEATDYWLDVKNTQLLTEEIKNKLNEISPENKEQIEQNYESYDDSLETLQEKYENLSSNNNTIFIGSAFNYKYLTDAYNINYISLYDDSTEDITPSVTRLNNFSKLLKKYNIKYIIKDNNSSSVGIESIKADLDYNLNVLIVDTMNSEEDDTSYIDVMNNNYVILKKAMY